MKVCLYFEGEKLIRKSGIGRAFQHQKEALSLAGVEYTTDPNDEYDILHINTIGPKSLSIIANARSLERKVIYHAHTTEEDMRNSFMFSNQVAPVMKQYITKLYSRADMILTPTPYSKSLLEGYGIDKPIYDVSNGINLKRFEYDEEKVKAFKTYFGLSANKKVIISVGLYFERKGITDFMEVAKTLPQYTFIWFGFTPLRTIPRHVQEAIKNAPDNVILPGYVKGAVIEGAFRAADCFFFPSNEETEGIVVLEALAAHQQVIVRDIGVYDPWLVDKVNCYKGNNNTEFSNLIVGVLEKSLNSTRDAGYKTAEEKSIANIGEKLKKAYQEVMDM
ncbi:MAG: glycosyltransferase [Erysipelotrichaceae bacterium]